MSKKKKISDEEKLSSVISDINAFTSKDRGKKGRPVYIIEILYSKKRN
jgi:hypothetical protein